MKEILCPLSSYPIGPLPKRLSFELISNEKIKRLRKYRAIFIGKMLKNLQLANLEEKGSSNTSCCE